MSTESILNELREQRDRLSLAITALEGAKTRGRRKGRHMSAEARRRIGLAMKRRWAAKKKEGA